MARPLLLFPKRLRADVRAISWTLGVFMGGISLAVLTYLGHAGYKRDYAEADRALHRQFIQQQIEVHHAYRDRAETEGARRFLTGYFSTADITKDLHLAYQGALKGGFLDHRGKAEYALVQHYLRDPPEKISAYLDQTFLGDEALSPYVQAILAVGYGQQLPDGLREFVESNADVDWYGGYLAYAAGVRPDYTTGDFWYERSVRHGAPALTFTAVTLLFVIPALMMLFRPAPRPLFETFRWHPSIVLGAAFWSLLFFQFAPFALFFPDFMWQGNAYHITSNVLYFAMQGGPVLVLAGIFALTPGRFARVFGLDRFPLRFLGLIFGLNGAYFLFNMGMWEIESRISGYDTRDFLNADLIGADTIGLISELVIAALIAPVCEELTFRGFLYTSMRNRVGPWLAAIVSTIIFAGLHYYSPLGLLSVAIFGMAMCWVYQKTGSLWPGILFHALFNFDVTVASWFLNSPELPSWLGN